MADQHEAKPHHKTHAARAPYGPQGVPRRRLVVSVVPARLALSGHAVRSPWIWFWGLLWTESPTLVRTLRRRLVCRLVQLQDRQGADGAVGFLAAARGA